MAPDMRKAAFIDRDGVINAEHHHVFRVADFHVLPGVVAGLRTLSEQGYALVVVTNQAGIAKGLYSEDDYAQLTQHMRRLFSAEGIEFSGVFHCPHHPQGQVARFAVSCRCRKPEPGMLLQAATELGLNLAQSVLVGDKHSDTLAGQAAGLRYTVLVESGHALPDVHETRTWADHRCAGLAEAASWLCSQDTVVTAPLSSPVLGQITTTRAVSPSKALTP
jgi:D-glycero-D-manno-heptose 1,7-bisphosphate phosphatase